MPCRPVFEGNQSVKVNEDWTGLIDLAHGSNTIIRNHRETLILPRLLLEMTVNSG